jgi:formylglycine-generating enzyme required for sulfatase activity
VDFQLTRDKVVKKEAGKEIPSSTVTKEKVVKGWGKEVTNSIGMMLVRIPRGTFTMGSPVDEKDREPHDKGSEQQHEVEITKDFWLGVHEVTQKEFKAVMGYNPSFHSTDGEGKPGVKYGWKPAGGKKMVARNTDDFPVENVSWDEAVDFCKKLSAREPKLGRLYRLPTEAEWEYACRGEAPSYQVFHFGDSLFQASQFQRQIPLRRRRQGPLSGSDRESRQLREERLRPARHARQRGGMVLGLV